ncbi:MAG: hypothetical protein A2W25_15225 [candidate division Zixibacteria bacterium RBG_16_53_22]|nr:MAG: hypothetical protein A2W25_15225 [candidate division Zixibacteria bacterium RBG_16_53_22]
MTVSVQLNQPAVDAFKAALKAAREGLKNDGVAMRQVAVFLDSWVQRNFKGKGSGVGGWVPFTYGGRLSLKRKATAYSKEARHWINTNAALLQDTGALRHSFLPFIRKGVAGIGSELPYSKPHDEGDDERNIPQRRILPEDREVRVQVFEILDNFVLLKTRGLK